jgi:hypothetical protein
MRTTKHCAATPRKTQRKGSTAGSCVSAIVCNHFLHIHNIERTFSPRVGVKFGIFGVVELDLYEWNWGQEFCKIPALERIWRRYVLQTFEIRAVFECLCPAKVRFAKRFLRKLIRQKCPAKTLFWSFDSAGRSKKVRGIRMVWETNFVKFKLGKRLWGIYIVLQKIRETFCKVWFSKSFE